MRWKVDQFQIPVPVRQPKARIPHNKGRTLSGAEIKLAREQAADGWTNQKIALYHGVSINQIKPICLGIKRRPSGR